MNNSPIVFVVPGSLEQRSGGTRYDRRITVELENLGIDVKVIELHGKFPFCDRNTERRATTVLENAEYGASMVIDGLALPAFAPAISRHKSRLQLIALIHHPLANETGLSPQEKRRLFNLERDALGHVSKTITTSEAIAKLMYAYNVRPENMHVVAPGTDPAGPIRRPRPDTIGLLCVAALIARKGHVRLLTALAECKALKWRLDCFGALDRDPDLTATVRRLITRFGLTDRVYLHGETDDATLSEAYKKADIFVLASEFEGYGMAYAEAMAHGLPVLASGGGAVCDTVPNAAGIIVPTGDHNALAAALKRIMSEPEYRAALASGSLKAGRRLPDWPQAARRFAAALHQAGSVPS